MSGFFIGGRNNHFSYLSFMKKFIFTLLALVPFVMGMAQDPDSLRVQLEIKILASDSVVYVDSAEAAEFEFDFKKKSGTIVLFRKMGREFGIRFYAASIWEEEKKITIARFVLMERLAGGTWNDKSSHGYQDIDAWSKILSIKTNETAMREGDKKATFHISLNSYIFRAGSGKRESKPEYRVYPEKN